MRRSPRISVKQNAIAAVSPLVTHDENAPSQSFSEIKKTSHITAVQNGVRRSPRVGSAFIKGKEEALHTDKTRLTSEIDAVGPSPSQRLLVAPFSVLKKSECTSPVRKSPRVHATSPAVVDKKSCPTDIHTPEKENVQFLNKGTFTVSPKAKSVRKVNPHTRTPIQSEGDLFEDSGCAKNVTDSESEEVFQKVSCDTSSNEKVQARTQIQSEVDLFESSTNLDNASHATNVMVNGKDGPKTIPCDNSAVQLVHAALTDSSKKRRLSCAQSPTDAASSSSKPPKMPCRQITPDSTNKVSSKVRQKSA